MVEIFHSAARHPLCCSRQPAAPTVRRGMNRFLSYDNIQKHWSLLNLLHYLNGLCLRKRLPDFTQRALVKAGILVQVDTFCALIILSLLVTLK